MGAVWLAHHETLGSDVAVKVMSPMLADTVAGASRFQREAKASAQLKSPHIVKVQDYGVEDGVPFMVMERLVGEDLGSRIATRKRLALEEVARIAGQVGKALRVAHREGIVHRDLKPSNMFLALEGGDEVVKLLDFGIARETRTELVDERTTSGLVLGSPYHMSPEQARGEAVDQRSDLWSLGVVIYRALTGVRPFDGDNVPAVLLAVVSGRFKRATALCPELPPTIDRFFEIALACDVDARFESAHALCEALDAIAGGRDATPWLEAQPPSAARRAGRDEPTETSAVPAATENKAPPSEITGSRTIAAVTTGLGRTTPRRGAMRRALPWLVAVVGVGTASFLVGRAWTTSEPPKQAVAEPAMAPAAAPPGIAPAAEPEPSAPKIEAPAPLPSASASAAVTSGARRAASPVPRPAPAPRQKPRTDPFTGLPVDQ